MVLLLWKRLAASFAKVSLIDTKTMCCPSIIQNSRTTSAESILRSLKSKKLQRQIIQHLIWTYCCPTTLMVIWTPHSMTNVTTSILASQTFLSCVATSLHRLLMACSYLSWYAMLEQVPNIHWYPTIRQEYTHMHHHSEYPSVQRLKRKEHYNNIHRCWLKDKII